MEDADATGAQQLQALGGDPVDGAHRPRLDLGDQCSSQLASAWASAAAADRRRTRPSMLTTMPVATSKATVMTWTSRSMTSVW